MACSPQLCVPTFISFLQSYHNALTVGCPGAAVTSWFVLQKTEMNYVNEIKVSLREKRGLEESAWIMGVGLMRKRRKLSPALLRKLQKKYLVQSATKSYNHI